MKNLVALAPVLGAISRPVPVSLLFLPSWVPQVGGMKGNPGNQLDSQQQNVWLSVRRPEVYFFLFVC